MTRNDFIKDIVDEITVGGSLGITLKEDEISKVIDREKPYFYMNARECVESKFTIMNPAAFRTPEYRESHTIALPDCIWGIQEFREIKDGSRLFGISDGDLTSDRIFNSDLFLNPLMGMSDIISSRTINYSYFDLMRTFTLVNIQFKFNVSSHLLSVIGHTPLAPVLLRVYAGIEESDLFEYYWFRRWVLGRCMIQIHRLLKTFEVNAIGGTSITSYFSEYGNNILTEAKEEIDKLNQPDWFLMFP